MSVEERFYARCFMLAGLFCGVGVGLGFAELGRPAGAWLVLAGSIVLVVLLTVRDFIREGSLS